MRNSLAVQWRRVCELFGGTDGVEYQAFLQHVSCVRLRGDTITLSVPTRFIKHWMNDRFAEHLLILWRGENNQVMHVEVVLEEAKN